MMDTQKLSPSFSCPIRRYVPSLPREAMEKAETELNETDELREKCIIKLRNWIETRPDLGLMDIGDLTLIWFLRSSKYDIDRTQKRLENYFTFRKNVPEWFSNRDPNLPELNKLFSLGCYLPLKHYDRDGRRVVLVRCCVHSPRQTVQDDVFKAGNMIQEILNRMDELISIYGVVAIFDLKGASLAHGMAMTPNIIKKAVTSWQDCVPVRIKALHFINTPYNVHIVLSIFKSFMKEKLRKRVHLHGGNLSSFHSYVPLGILPEEYGGMSGPTEELVEYWKQSTEAAREWYLEEDKYLKESVAEKNFEKL